MRKTLVVLLVILLSINCFANSLSLKKYAENIVKDKLHQMLEEKLNKDIPVETFLQSFDYLIHGEYKKAQLTAGEEAIKQFIGILLGSGSSTIIGWGWDFDKYVYNSIQKWAYNLNRKKFIDSFLKKKIEEWKTDKKLPKWSDVRNEMYMWFNDHESEIGATQLPTQRKEYKEKFKNEMFAMTLDVFTKYKVSRYKKLQRKKITLALIRKYRMLVKKTELKVERINSKLKMANEQPTIKNIKRYIHDKNYRELVNATAKVNIMIRSKAPHSKGLTLRSYIAYRQRLKNISFSKFYNAYTQLARAKISPYIQNIIMFLSNANFKTKVLKHAKENKVEAPVKIAKQTYSKLKQQISPIAIAAAYPVTYNKLQPSIKTGTATCNLKIFSRFSKLYSQNTKDYLSGKINYAEYLTNKKEIVDKASSYSHQIYNLCLNRKYLNALKTLHKQFYKNDKTVILTRKHARKTLESMKNEIYSIKRPLTVLVQVIKDLKKTRNSNPFSLNLANMALKSKVCYLKNPKKYRQKIQGYIAYLYMKSSTAATKKRRNKIHKTGSNKSENQEHYSIYNISSKTTETLIVHDLLDNANNMRIYSDFIESNLPKAENYLMSYIEKINKIIMEYDRFKKDNQYLLSEAQYTPVGYVVNIQDNEKDEFEAIYQNIEKTGEIIDKIKMQDENMKIYIPTLWLCYAFLQKQIIYNNILNNSLNKIKLDYISEKDLQNMNIALNNYRILSHTVNLYKQSLDYHNSTNPEKGWKMIGNLRTTLSNHNRLSFTEHELILINAKKSMRKCLAVLSYAKKEARKSKTIIQNLRNMAKNIVLWMDNTKNKYETKLKELEYYPDTIKEYKTICNENLLKNYTQLLNLMRLKYTELKNILKQNPKDCVDYAFYIELAKVFPLYEKDLIIHMNKYEQRLKKCENRPKIYAAPEIIEARVNGFEIYKKFKPSLLIKKGEEYRIYKANAILNPISLTNGIIVVKGKTRKRCQNPKCKLKEVVLKGVKTSHCSVHRNNFECTFRPEHYGTYKLTFITKSIGRGMLEQTLPSITYTPFHSFFVKLFFFNVANYYSDSNPRFERFFSNGSTIAATAYDVVKTNRFKFKNIKLKFDNVKVISYRYIGKPFEVADMKVVANWDIVYDGHRKSGKAVVFLKEKSIYPNNKIRYLKIYKIEGDSFLTLLEKNTIATKHNRPGKKIKIAILSHKAKPGIGYSIDFASGTYKKTEEDIASGFVNRKVKGADRPYFNVGCIRDMGKVGFNSVKVCPKTGYSNYYDYTPAYVGHTYCVRTKRGGYAKLEVLEVGGVGINAFIKFKWEYSKTNRF